MSSSPKSVQFSMRTVKEKEVFTGIAEMQGFKSLGDMARYYLYQSADRYNLQEKYNKHLAAKIERERIESGLDREHNV